MKYLVVQDWSNTHGNHAGMVHMCKMLKKNYPNDYDLIVKDKIFTNKTGFWGGIYNTFALRYYIHYGCTKHYLKICSNMFQKLKPGDEVFLLEYMVVQEPQLGLAKYLKKKFPKVKVYALCHLTPTFYGNGTTYPKLINEWSSYVDKLLTLGSSLTNYFIYNGLDTDKISTGYHYVDNEYYHKDIIKTVGDRLKVIVSGGMQRNYSLLVEIVKATPSVDWIICRGRKPVDDLFKGLNNAVLMGYLSEEDLRRQMDIADVSVNIMDDTIGSNVITTSMSMGLAMVVSDVGSIRDYCNETNAIFCSNTVDSFVSAINLLSTNHRECDSMKENSIELSKSLSIDNINKWLSSIGDPQN